ncbi:uncharacterized protein LOC135167064 [Diachasmimorpha longicaudata]|uniref:uncharacterized protein LOC135167064 n=1 Tax=Diachasmimorpha longicaudata TaxID=58733 RepID=UPI0030B8DE2C
MSLGLMEWLVTVSAVIIALYYYFVSNYNFWKSRGVPGPTPIPIFGNMKPMFNGKVAWQNFLINLYENYKEEAMIGIYMRKEPVLLIQDLDIIKTILIKDFSNFADRMEQRDVHNPLSNHLFMLEAKMWRPLRTKLSPVFTSGKIRDMFYLLNECATHLENYLNEVDGDCIDMRDVAAKFTTDAIGLCAFGVEANALGKEDSVFRQMGKRIFSQNWKVILKFRMMRFCPPLHRLLGGLLEDYVLQDFFINLTRDTVDYRKKMNITRHDFIDLLRSLRDEPSQIDDIELTDSLMAAQLFVFFVAGFETSSSAISNCLFELAMNHEIQNKLRSEIRREFGESGEITYDKIKRMEYLDMAVNETLRKYPPLSMLMRMGEQAYKIPGTDVSLPARAKIMIPICAIQKDSRYFPEPEVFNPENFSEEAVKGRHPMTFLAFGDGPRNCIGARFGRIQTKIGLVKIIQKFVVDVCEKTDKNYELNNRSFLLTPKNGIVIRVTKCSWRLLLFFSPLPSPLPVLFTNEKIRCRCSPDMSQLMGFDVQTQLILEPRNEYIVHRRKIRVNVIQIVKNDETLNRIHPLSNSKFCLANLVRSLDNLLPHICKMAVVLEVLVVITTALMALYYYLTNTFDFWKSRGIPGPKPIAIFGTMKESFLARMNIATYLTSIYRNYPGEPLIGLYQSRKPVLMVNDLDLIKDIMIKDFSKFADRGTSEDKFDPLSANLVSLAAEKWRPLRGKLSPVFTSGKLKDMFHLLVQCSDEFERYLEGINYESVDIRDICAKYTTDIIGVCAFGLQANSMREGDSIFRVMGTRIFNPTPKQVLKGILVFNFPAVYNIVGRYLQDYELINFFLNLTKDTMDYRRKNHVVRHDFVDLLMKIKDDRTVEDIEITDELLAAQLFIFFGGGFETSAGAISNTLFELALNPSVQEKLRKEIHETLEKNDGRMSYQNIKSMEYLDSVIKETLRKYPPIPLLSRVSMTSYTFPGFNLTIPKGTMIMVPTYAIHRDPQYFANPEKFYPERFGKDSTENHPDMCYLPFGDGPRNCIGSRFALVQVKAGLITVLKSYAVEVCDKTDKNYEINEKAFLLAPKNGVFLNMKKLKK